MTSRGNLDEKLQSNWYLLFSFFCCNNNMFLLAAGAFKLYDVDNDVFITRAEMHNIVDAIYQNVVSLVFKIFCLRLIIQFCWHFRARRRALKMRTLRSDGWTRSLARWTRTTTTSSRSTSFAKGARPILGSFKPSRWATLRDEQTLQDNSPFSLSLSLHSTLNRISSSPFPLYIRFSTLFIFLSTVLVEYLKFSFFFPLAMFTLLTRRELRCFHLELTFLNGIYDILIRLLFLWYFLLNTFIFGQEKRKKILLWIILKIHSVKFLCHRFHIERSPLEIGLT